MSIQGTMCLNVATWGRKKELCIRYGNPLNSWHGLFQGETELRICESVSPKRVIVGQKQKNWYSFLWVGTMEFTIGDLFLASANKKISGVRGVRIRELFIPLDIGTYSEITSYSHSGIVINRYYHQDSGTVGITAPDELHLLGTASVVAFYEMMLLGSDV